MPPTFIPLISGLPTADTPNPIIDQLLNIIEDLYENSGLQSLLSCENPAHTRGWKVDWIDDNKPDILGGTIDLGFRTPSISWAPCDCYDTLEWPALSLSLVSVGIVIRKLRRKVVRKIGIYIKDAFGSSVASFRARWYRFKNWGLADWAKFLKLPPVQPGYKRLYRMNRGGGPPTIASDTNGYGTGRWFTDDPDYAIRHSRFTQGDSYVTYIDIPLEIANNNHMGNPNSRWRQLLSASGHSMSGGRGVDPSKLTENPARFVASESIARYEYFLDSNVANQSTKIAQFTGLGDLEEFDNQWKKFEVLFKEYDGEKFLDDIGYRNDFISRWNITTSQLKALCSKYFDNSDEVFQWLLQGSEWYGVPDVTGPDIIRLPSVGLETIFSADRIIMKRTAYALALITFIVEIMSITDLVREKNCSPIGKDSTYGLTEKDKIFIKQLRDTAISQKVTTWAELDKNTCECTDCPSEWNLCDNRSILNLYSSYGNTCHPPCCGGQEWKPITLVETCKCECPEGKIFMPCDCSDCSEGSGTPLLDIVIGTNKIKGICIENNPDPEKLEWNKTTCRWECKTFTYSYPPHLWGGSIKVPIIPSCRENQQRDPYYDCDCSGSYSLDPCVGTNSTIFNIVSVKEIKLM
jgi:hypothetical protein